MTDLPKDIERELAALADGSLPPGRREAALERARRSSQMRDAFSDQQRAVDLFASVEERAPASVHRQIERMLEPRREKRKSSKARFGLAGVAVGALATVALVLSLSSSGLQGLNVQQAAALTLSPATMGAPAESKTDRAELAAGVGGVSFPYWKERFGWRSAGARTDRVAGRSVTTVFYSNARGQRIGYAIVSGPAPQAHGGIVTSRWGIQYRVLSHDGATIVTWKRSGQLCVVGGMGVNAHTLLSLASWGSEKSHPA